MPGTIRTTRDGGLTVVALSNPDKLNAVDAQMWRDLGATMLELARDPDVACVLLRGDGDKAFAAGGDIEEFLTVGEDWRSPVAATFVSPVNQPASAPRSTA